MDEPLLALDQLHELLVLAARLNESCGQQTLFSKRPPLKAARCTTFTSGISVASRVVTLTMSDARAMVAYTDDGGLGPCWLIVVENRHHWTPMSLITVQAMAIRAMVSSKHV